MASQKKGDKYEYQSGFANHFESEALPNTLPAGQINPQKCAHGLYAEQLSGTAFTKPRVHNQRVWYYRIQPSVKHEPFVACDENPLLDTASFGQDPATSVNPNQLRWAPFDLPAESDSVHFVQGIKTLMGSGSPESKSGIAIHYYTANRDMVDSAFNNADGDLLIVPQLGSLDIRTEHGFFHVSPNEIVVIPRGVRFAVNLPDGPSRGYILEIFQGHFTIPDLGPIGANGLANPRDFLTPVAAYENRSCDFAIYNKYMGRLFKAKSDHSCFDVVGWHGNYVPFKYDLAKFIAMNSVTKDHPDPSIFTVLTCQTLDPGVAAADFVIFPPRWSVADNTFRPPYYHRNTMSEYMGLIKGSYEAKEKGFVPGGSSLHSCMTPHGPDTAGFEAWTNKELGPLRIQQGDMAFMFETCYMLHLTKFAASSDKIEHDYYTCWQDLPNNFVEPGNNSTKKRRVA